MASVHGIHSRDDEDCQYLLDGGVDGLGCSGARAGDVIRVPGDDRIPGREENRLPAAVTDRGRAGGGEQGRERGKSRIIPGVSAARARNRYAVHRSATLLGGAVAPALTFDHCEGVATVKFHLDRGVLGDAVSWATRTLPVRPAMPILQGVRIIADAGGELQLSTFDYEVSAQIRLEAEVEQPGEVLVQGRMLSDIVRAL